MATGCSGIRTATVPRVSPRSHVQRRLVLGDERQRAGPEGVDELPGLLGEVGDQAVQGVRGADEDRGGHVAAAALGLQQVADGLRR